eukprot:COSAG02_NODE_20796_length_815_cov_1.150838_1_plen_137_part_01
MLALVEEAQEVSPKKRSKVQRQAIAWHKQRQKTDPMFESGPMPSGSCAISSMMPDRPAPQTTVPNGGVFSRIGKLLTMALLILSPRVPMSDAVPVATNTVTECSVTEPFIGSMDQTWQNRGTGRLVRDAMVYHSDGT